MASFPGEFITLCLCGELICLPPIDDKLLGSRGSVFITYGFKHGTVPGTQQVQLHFSLVRVTFQSFKSPRKIFYTKEAYIIVKSQKI